VTGSLTSNHEQPSAQVISHEPESTHFPSTSHGGRAEGPALSQSAAPPALPAFTVSPTGGPVGARLLHFWRNWALINANKWTLAVLSKGYFLPIEGEVPLTKDPPSLGYHSRHPLFEELRGQIQIMLDKRAIEEVTEPSAGYYSRLFLAPKKSGEWRPVIDLSSLNKYMSPPHFQMETVQSIILGTKLDKWATSIDLKDAFFHIPVAPRHRKFLRFIVDGHHYQFRALPFGLGMSPYVFTRVMKNVGAYARSQGLTLFLYLDDWLLLSDSYERALAWIQWLLKLVQALGLLPNVPKCDLTPSQIYIFIGVLFNLVQGSAQPAPHRVAAFIQLADRFLHTPSPRARDWQRLLGHMTSLERLVHRGRLYMRPIQFCLQSQWHQFSQSQEVPVSTSVEARQCVEWWLDPAHLVRGVPIVQAPPDLRLFTDASTEGWGAHILDAQAEGRWSATQQKLHINVLELLAVLLALQALEHLVTGRHVLAMTDNTTVVGQIRNQGGTHSRRLFRVTQELFSWADDHQIILSAQHIPGRLNVLADLLSRRHQVIHTEWSLCPQVASQIWRLWGQPHLDLFATAANAKLPTFVSPYPDPRAWDTDALSLSWRGMWAYAFPPFSLLNEILSKVQQEPCDLVLVAPAWLSQPWFSTLLDLVVDHPRSLPLHRKLLKQPDQNVFHDQLQSLHLHAWRLSSRPCAPKASLRTWRGVLPAHTEIALDKFTTVDGMSSVHGADLEDGILSLPLPR